MHCIRYRLPSLVFRWNCSARSFRAIKLRGENVRAEIGIKCTGIGLCSNRKLSCLYTSTLEEIDFIIKVVHKIWISIIIMSQDPALNRPWSIITERWTEYWMSAANVAKPKLLPEIETTCMYMLLGPRQLCKYIHVKAIMQPLQ